MKAVVAAFNQEKALVGAFSVSTNLRMEHFEAISSSQLEVAATRGGKCRLMEAGCKNQRLKLCQCHPDKRRIKLGLEKTVGLLSEASNTMVMFFTIPGGSWLATIKIVVHGEFTTCMAVILRQDKQ